MHVKAAIFEGQCPSGCLFADPGSHLRPPESRRGFAPHRRPGRIRCVGYAKVKRDVKKNILPCPRQSQEFGRLHPAPPLSTRVSWLTALNTPRSGESPGTESG